MTRRSLHSICIHPTLRAAQTCLIPIAGADVAPAGTQRMTRVRPPGVHAQRKSCPTQHGQEISMVITRYRPQSFRLWPPEFSDLERQMRRLGELVEPGFAPERVAFFPPVEMAETPDALVLTAELPGMKPEEVSIEVENNILTIKGEKKEEIEEKEARYHLWERSYGAFVRSLPLPGTVNADLVKAEFDGGVLTIRMPKIAESKGRKIEVKAKK
jgi:HSP20 family protein